MATPLSPTNEILMLQYLSGDEASFEELYDRLSPKVFSYLLKKLGRRQDAEELMQSVFLKFHRSRHQYDAKYPVLQWVFVISKSALLDFYRKEGRQVPLQEGLRLEDAEHLALPAAPAALEPSFDEAQLNKLTPEQRKAVEWRYVNDLSFAEIASRLGKQENTVRQNISRAIRKLRSTLGRNGSKV